MTTPTEKSSEAITQPLVPRTLTKEDQPGVLPEFRAYDLNELGIKKTRAIRAAMSAALEVVEACCPKTSRERSIVVTKLQEAAMFANLAVCVDPDNQAAK